MLSPVVIPLTEAHARPRSLERSINRMIDAASTACSSWAPVVRLHF
ncbi:MAG: hypothetical protein ACLT98_05885 [Eggerthellaceae bacterium]